MNVRDLLKKTATPRLRRLAAPGAFGTLLIAVQVLALGYVSWNAFNHLTRHRPLTDSGVFAAVGLHLLEGKAPYREVWDNKQPMIFLLDALALKVGDGSANSIRAMERVFSVARAVLLFAIIARVFGSVWLAFFASLFLPYLFYDTKVYEYGNLTEEYGTVFVLGGVLLVLFAREASGRASLVFSLFAGLLFSLAVWTKENFLLSSVPWFFYLVWTRRMNWKAGAFRSGAFVVGALIPLFLFVAYFSYHGAVGDWLDMISYNLEYSELNEKSASFVARFHSNIEEVATRVFSQSKTAPIAFWIALVGMFFVPFLKRHRFFPLVAALAFFFDYWGTIVSERGLGHYYMQLVPSYVMVGACGGGFLLYAFERGRGWKPGLIVLLGLSLFVFDYASGEKYVKRFRSPIVRVGPEAIGKFVRANSEKDDPFWVMTIHSSKYYLETDRLSPTRHIAPHPLHFIDTGRSSGDESFSAVRGDLERNPPKFIVYSSNYILKKEGILDWVDSHYTKTSVVEGKTLLYVRKTEETKHIWSMSPGDYVNQYAAANFLVKQWPATEETFERREKYRRLIFFQNEAAARSVEAIEAEQYESRTRTNFRKRQTKASGGYVVGNGFGGEGDSVEYTFFLDRDVSDGFFHVIYAAEEGAGNVDVYVDGLKVARAELRQTEKGAGFEEEKVVVEGLKAGLRRLRIVGLGAPVVLDLYYFTERR